MHQITKHEYEKRLAKISEIFAGMASHALEQAQSRCPYKNRFDQCTAQFGCRNKRKPAHPGQLPICAADDKLDYRPAWQSDPESYDRMRQVIKNNGKNMTARQNQSLCAHVCHDGKKLASEAGKTIFDYADELSVRVPTSCGRTGHCHECIVDVTIGIEALQPRTESEAFLSGNYRLACQACVEKIDTDIAFALLRRTPKILVSCSNVTANIDPVVVKQGGNVYYDGELIDRYRGRLCGLTLDLGTTTCVSELVDLESGESIYAAAFENPQRFGGSDVMNRISYDAGAFTGEMHRAIINTFNSEIRQMCDRLNIDHHTIYEIVVVGNSTMRELFFDHDVQAIGQKPYKCDIETQYLSGDRTTTALTVPARRLRLFANKNARIFGVPVIASHIGSDVVADLVAIDMPAQNEVVMLADAGTNTEVILGHRDRLLAASCPAGPAFEGGGVTYGMPGCDGAIESIQYKNDRFEYKVIGDAAPLGICGSGLIELLAELRRHKLMTAKGVFSDGRKSFTIAPGPGGEPGQDITLSRRDASELAQAKAANYCGQIILMRKFGVTPDQINRFFLAGGFANYVDSASAVEIGFMAPVPFERIIKVGNAAAQGARLMLLSKRKRIEIEKLIKTIEHVELESTPDFFEIFVDGCQFNPMRLPVAPPP